MKNKNLIYYRFSKLGHYAKNNYSTNIIKENRSILNWEIILKYRKI